MTDFVTYAHKDSPNGSRFKQEVSEPVPRWAANIEFNSGDPLTYAEQAATALAKLPLEFQNFVTSQAYARGHSSGEDEVNMIAAELASEMLTVVEAYNTRTKVMSTPDPLIYDISGSTVLKAAVDKYGQDVKVSDPYWVDHEHVRFGIQLGEDGASFGANFFYKLGKFV
jgi:hypothetical protein